MTYKSLLLFIGIFSGQATAMQSSIEIIEKFDDIKVVAFIKTDDIKNYPEWHPSQEEPPLSIKQAITAITNIANNKELQAATVNEIELREVPHYNHLWHYLIKFKQPKSKPEVYVVLLNGIVIPAIIVPESFK